MVTSAHTKEEVIGILSSIPDPEIPVVSISEMGMLRDVTISKKGCEVILTPTYSGCPAMGIIEAEIRQRLEAAGIYPVTVKLVYEPAWTTDWISEETKRRMLAYGIAPPLHTSCNNDKFILNVIACPKCGSKDTTLLSRYGSTACKALYKCNKCIEPFEYFKCH